MWWTMLMHQKSNRKRMPARRASDLTMTSSEAFFTLHSCIQVRNKRCTLSNILASFVSIVSSSAKLALRSIVYFWDGFRPDIVSQAKSCSCCFNSSWKVSPYGARLRSYHLPLCTSPLSRWLQCQLLKD